MRLSSERYVMICLFIAFTMGCASTTSFRYDHTKNIKPVATDIILVVAYPIDGRQPNEQVDKMWDKSLFADIDNIIRHEINSTGLFREVTSGSNDKEYYNKRVILNTTINELVWEIPNLKEQERNTFIISVLTGGIGGLAYGSGETDFYGKAKIRMILTDQEAKKDILDKEYFYRAEEKMARLKTDSIEERARIIGVAFKHVMEQFKVDIEQLIKAGKIQSS